MHLLLALLLAQAKPVDERLVLERVAAEPDIVTPTGMSVAADGRIWAIESNTHFPPKNYKGHPTDRILVFEDLDADGRARKITTFADGFRYGMSLKHGRNGEVFFATRWEIWSFRETDAKERKLLAKLETKGDYPHNGLCGFAIDPEGLLYFGIGENLGLDYKLVGSDGTTLSGGGEGGNVYRMKTDGNGLERVATGFWNPFNMDFDAFGRLFVVDNDPDSRPPNRLLHIVPGGDYGYRFRNGRKGLHPFTAWNGELPGTLGMVAGTGEGASGVWAYEANGLPPDYRGTLLVTSWGDHQIQKFRLVPKGASFTSRAETVVKGGEDFRPVGIGVGPDGAVYFTDWVDKSYNVHGKGRLWRLRTKGGVPSPPADPLRERLATFRSGRAVEAGLSDPDESIRAEAARLCRDEGTLLKLATSDPSLLVRMQAILGLRAPVSLPAVVPFLGHEDPFLVSAAIETLSKVGGVELLRGIRDPKLRVGALLALRRKGDRAWVPHFLNDSDPGVRRAVIQWVGEESLKEHAEVIGRLAAEPPVTRAIFEAYLAAADFLNAGDRHKGDAAGSDFFLAKVLEDAKQSGELRALSLRMLKPGHPALALPKLEKYAAEPGTLGLEAVRAIGATPTDEAQRILRRIAAQEGPARADAVLGLAHSALVSAETRKLLISLLGGDLGADALSSLSGTGADAEARAAVEGLKGADPEKVALVLGKVPAGRPEANDDWRKALAEPGDAKGGERVFFHPRGPQCFVCHTINGRGGRVGPDLSTIGRSIGREKIVDSILEPSKEIAPMFVSWRVLTKDDDVYDGRLFAEDPAAGEIHLVNAQAQVIKIKLSEIRDRKVSALSLMPEKLWAAMTRKEFRDLVSFLEGLR